MSIIDMLQNEAEKSPESATNSVAEQATTEPTTEEKIDNTSDVVVEEEKKETKESEEISKEVVETETPKSTPEQKQAEFASEKVAKYNEFVKKTGKEDYSEFLHWQTPTDELNKEELLRRYYSEQEGMSEKEIAYKLSTMDVSESQDPDDDFAEPLDEQERLKREALMEGELRKARGWREAELSKMGTMSESTAQSSTDSEPQKYTVEEYTRLAYEQQQKANLDYREKLYGALPEFTSTPITISGNKENNILDFNADFTFDEDDKARTQKIGEDLNVLISQHFDENGQVKDYAKWLDDLSWMDDTIRTKKLKFMIEQAILQDRGRTDKARRNVTADNYQPIIGGTSNSEEDYDNFRKSKDSGY